MKIGEIEFTLQDIKDILNQGKSLPFVKKYRLRNKEDKIGVIIAITTEEVDEKNRVENDLIRAVNNILNSDDLAGLFNVKQLDEKDSKEIDNSNWLKFLDKYNSHLIIYGHVAKRNAGEGYSIRLEAGVRHKPIPPVVGNLLSSEFAVLFPRERFIPANNDLLGFEITAKEIAFVAQYMIGVAFFVSGFLGLSFEMLNSLRQKIDQINKEEFNIEQIKLKNIDRLVDVSLGSCFLLYDYYSLKRDLEFIKETKKYFDVINQFKPEEKKIKSLEAMYYFLIEENVKKAVEIVKSFDDPIKHYNLAFLYFFKGDIDQGLIHYHKAFKRNISTRSLNDLEMFISDMIEKTPDKEQLLFARALISYKGKGEYELALGDLNEFINRAYYNLQLKELVKLSVKYKFEIKRKL